MGAGGEWALGLQAAVLSAPELLPAAESSKVPARALPQGGQQLSKDYGGGKGAASPCPAALDAAGTLRRHPRTRTDVLQHGSISEYLTCHCRQQALQKAF